MHKYIPHTDDEIKNMLDEIGVDSTGNLFDDIPQSTQISHIGLEDGKSELEVLKQSRNLSKKNKNTNDMVCFLGAGAYDHYIPTVINSIISRQEFYTSYTPYQPEISQGTLTAIFEYQTMICELTGMDVANASMYDGATAAAEAINVACGASRKNAVLIPKNINPEIKAVINTYAKFSGKVIIEINTKDGQIDIDDFKSKFNGDIGAVLIQSPNFYGIIEDIKPIADLVHETKAKLIVSADPSTLGVLEAPDKLGADIVVGDAQPLGNALSFGGPYVGYFAANSKLMRKIPGRLVGETKDVDGKRAYVLTIQTREQHIRRDKATSNICSNQGLNALIACIYMATMGKEGIKEMGQQCVNKSHYALDRLLETGYFKKAFDAPFFKEFTVKYTGKDGLSKYLLDKDILFGYDMIRSDKTLENHYLIAVTEKRSKCEIDNLAEEIVKFNTEKVVK